MNARIALFISFHLLSLSHHAVLCARIKCTFSSFCFPFSEKLDSFSFIDGKEASILTCEIMESTGLLTRTHGGAIERTKTGFEPDSGEKEAQDK
jgi:hypothetical protein